ncbi:MAG: DUF4197 domain-containing protein [Nitrosomonadales bacterium]|nr:MAG: DUF4197 domain-containing protein [Nitrosomonadales bacterium]
MNKKIVLFVSILSASGSSVQAGWQDTLQGGLDGVLGSKDSSSSAVSALSQTEMAGGLKEALAQGAESAINSLGKTDGFLANDLVKIPLPEKVKKIAGLARKFGGKKYVDEFVTTMNRAAESAVPEAATIFSDSIRDMSIEDAEKILSGADDSATQYFRKTGGTKFAEKFKPMVKRATDAAGVAKAYKQMIGQAGPMVSMLGGNDLTDIDGYVTNKAVDGLFKMIAAEEKRIRANPLASGSDLMKKVFSSFQ